MILRRLSLKNFRKYGRAEIAFPEGLVGVVGPNGSGKSTIFEAVAWALFGNEMSRTGGFGLASAEVRAGAECSAELEFELDGARVFRVCRRLAGGGEFTQARVEEGRETLASGSRASDAAVRRLLELDAGMFRKVVYARQGELGGLAKDAVGYRRRFVERFLDLDWLDRARAQVAADRRPLECLADDPAGPDVERLETIAGEARAESERLRRERDELVRTLEAWEMRFKRFHVLRAEAEVLEREVSVLVRVVAERRKSLAAIPSASANARAKEAALRERLGGVRGRIQACSLQVARLSKRLDAAGDKCPYCGGALSPDWRRRIQAEHCEVLSEVRALREEEAALAKTLGVIEWERCRAGRRLELERQRVRDETELAERGRRLAALKTDLGQVNFDEEGYEALKARSRALAVALDEATARAAKLDARLVEARVRQAASARRKGERKRFLALGLLDGLFRDFRSERIAGFLPLVEKECSEILVAATDGRYARLALDRELNVRLREGVKSFVLNRFSGGEQDVACLALRLGWLRGMTQRCPVRFAVLDEIFGSQDREHRRCVLRALGRLCPPFRQIFVVTHAEDVQEILPVVLRVGGDGAGAAAVETG